MVYLQGQSKEGGGGGGSCQVRGCTHTYTLTCADETSEVVGGAVALMTTGPSGWPLTSGTWAFWSTPVMTMGSCVAMVTGIPEFWCPPAAME